MENLLIVAVVIIFIVASYAHRRLIRAPLPKRAADDAGPDKSSYQHPDNWPKKRIDAPPGTSD